MQHHAEDEEVGEHQQQRVDDGPERSAERAPVAPQHVAPHHHADQPAIAPDRQRPDRRTRGRTARSSRSRRSVPRVATRVRSRRAAPFAVDGLHQQERPAALVIPAHAFPHGRRSRLVAPVLRRHLEFERTGALSPGSRSRSSCTRAPSTIRVPVSASKRWYPMPKPSAARPCFAGIVAH